MEAVGRNNGAFTGTEFIYRLGYRELQAPGIIHCVRNGEALRLEVRYFENRQGNGVIYYTEAYNEHTGGLRHTTVFTFPMSCEHAAIHQRYLHELFLDTEIENRFEEENKFMPAAHLSTDHVALFDGWVRFCWNTNHFREQYKKLGGLEYRRQLLTLGPVE